MDTDRVRDRENHCAPPERTGMDEPGRCRDIRPDLTIRYRCLSDIGRFISREVSSRSPHGDKPASRFTFRCAECGHRFRSTQPKDCPRCGGADVEVKTEDGSYAPA